MLRITDLCLLKRVFIFMFVCGCSLALTHDVPTSGTLLHSTQGIGSGHRGTGRTPSRRVPDATPAQSIVRYRTARQR